MIELKIVMQGRVRRLSFILYEDELFGSRSHATQESCEVGCPGEADAYPNSGGMMMSEDMG